MKKIWKLFLIAGMGIALQFCSSDESPANKVVINGESYIKANLFTDTWGSSCYALECNGPTHTDFGFVITDGEYDGDEWFEYYNYLMLFELYSPGTEEFQAGTYDIYSWNNFEEADYTGKKFGFGYLDTSGIGNYYTLFSGTVKVSGTYPKLSFSYNITVNLAEWNGEEYVTKETFTIKGKNSGTFDEVSID